MFVFFCYLFFILFFFLKLGKDLNQQGFPYNVYIRSRKPRETTDEWIARYVCLLIDLYFNMYIHDVNPFRLIN